MTGCFWILKMKKVRKRKLFQIFVLLKLFLQDVIRRDYKIVKIERHCLISLADKPLFFKFRMCKYYKVFAIHLHTATHGFHHNLT